MPRFLVTPVIAVLATMLSAPAAQAVKLPNLGQCVTVTETSSRIGFHVCVPPTS